MFYLYSTTIPRAWKRPVCRSIFHQLWGAYQHTPDIYNHAFDKNKRFAGQKLSEAMGL